ncbi:hypothetical protein MHAE_04345 [Mycobacterium haemophilum DSM 44634]|uniref:hypothetical protein n=1 Tax=Mycobacterium haemophilum TaxID=29311 RepID=UPI000655E86D|nr:hypothetical protein [Mycobacterium haemophilum]AKN17480.1 hypothetical protein B586_14295 [Mycobacterium haemophilum DSM 44634]MCV7341603.1 hypothetical protein [Mycobacterium haemophilum DSM 44634]
MTTTPPPDVPLPAGTRPVGGWEDGRRVLSTDAQQVDFTELLVSAVVTQLADGSLGDEPSIHVDECDEYDGSLRERLTLGVEGARELAQALLKLCNQVDKWAW